MRYAQLEQIEIATKIILTCLNASVKHFRK